MRTILRSIGRVALLVVGFLLVATLIMEPMAGQSTAPKVSSGSDIFPIRLDSVSPDLEQARTFDPGTEDDAKRYYKSVSEQLKLPGGERPFENLDALLAYFGYDQLKAKELDLLAPKELAAKVAGDALVGRYFSPKTSDVSGRSNKLSWRKVARLRPRSHSQAEKAGLAAMHFLSVVYVDCRMDDPFPATGSKTVNVQVLLTRQPGWAAGQDPAYWLVFQPAGGSYRLDHSTTTSWDAADPELVEGLQAYYVPTACQMCHGGNPQVAVLHMFDTDWYLDKTQAGEDFGLTFKNAKWGPLYDCGKDAKSTVYKEGFDTFRKLNGEILRQNRAVLAVAEASDPKHRKGATRQVARQVSAAAKWVELHRASDEHFPPLDRALAIGSPGERLWDKNDPIDKELLPLLNRYCYRCHSSVKYNAFAKEELIRKREDGARVVSKMIEKMTKEKLVDRMPQDRDMEDRHHRDWKNLLDLLRRLQAKYPSH